MKLISRAGAGYLATLVSGLAIGIAVVGTASAAPAATTAASRYIHVAPATVTHHYSLAASAFAPDGLHNTASDYFNQWDPTTLSNQNSGRCFNAGLSLPPGITLKSVTFHYTAGSSLLYMEINRQNLTNHTSLTLASFDASTVTTPTYTSKTKTIANANAKVDMGKYAYSAGVCPIGTSTFSAVTITYTQP